MAKYAISQEGAESMNALAQSLLQAVNSILESTTLLKQKTSELGTGLGIYEEDILALISQNAVTIKNNRDAIVYLANSARNTSSSILSLLALGFSETTSGFGESERDGETRQQPSSAARSFPAGARKFSENVAFMQDGFSPDRFFSVGNHYAQYQNYWEHLGEYKADPTGDREIVFVRARDIEGVYINSGDFDNPNHFWLRGRSGYSLEGIQEKAAKINEVKSRVDNGESLESLRNDPRLSDAIASYTSDPICVSQLEDFFVFESDGRHRTLASQDIDGWIPVIITSRLSRR